MGSIQKKRIRGRAYFYYMESKRIGGKPKTVVQDCLGSEERLIRQIRKGCVKPKAIESKEFGATATALGVLEELGLAEIIDGIIHKRKQLISYGQALLIDALNRCVDPCPNYKLGDWYNTTFLKRVFGIDYRKLNGQNFWNWMNKFNEKNIGKVQDEIFIILVKKFKVDIRKIIIDFTNFTTFQVEHKKNQLAQHGAAKDKHYWLRQVNIALATNKDGVPLRHSSYKGNINDPTYYKTFFRTFIKNYSEFLKTCEKVWFIHDKGMNNEESVSYCDKNEKYNFIGSLKPSSCNDFMLIPLSKFKDPYADERSEQNKKTFLAYRTKKVVFGKERTIVITYYEATAKKKFYNLTEKLAIAFEELAELRRKLNTNKWKTKKEVEKKISKIINKGPIKSIIGFKVNGKKNNLGMKYWIDSEKLQFKIETFGKSFLFTDDDSLKTKEIISAYFKEKNTIEVCNKLLKSSKYSKIKPMDCWTDIQIRAHVFSCVISLLVESLLRIKLEENNVKSVVQHDSKKGLPIMSVQEAIDHLREIREDILFYPGKLKGERMISRMNKTQIKLFKIFSLEKHL